MRVMVLWSGGVESTALALRLIREARDEVFLHYVRMHSGEGRAECEDRAVEALLPELRRVGPLHFDRSEVSLVGGLATGVDYHLQYAVGLVAMHHHKCQRLLRGLCAEDDWSRGPGRPQTKCDGVRHHVMRRAMEHMLWPGESVEEVAPTLPEYFEPKAWHWLQLGELADLTWSCRVPVTGRPCLKCRACLERECASRGISYVRGVKCTQVTKNS